MSDPAGDARALDVDGLDRLIAALSERGFAPHGPIVRDGSIVWGPLRGVADLPAGWTLEQDAGRCQLVRRGDGALFGWAVGPDSPKRLFLPPSLQLFTARRDDEGGFALDPPAPAPGPIALIGARPCEIAAIAVQDRVLLGSEHTDAHYRARRDEAFIVAAHCGEPGGTCFCVSADTGPSARSGFDLALTELHGDGEHTFVIEVATERGAAVLEAVPHRAATGDEIARAAAVVTGAASRMGRELETDGLRELLYGCREHPRWDEIAARCLGCANCTMVCPTCFCTSVSDLTDITGATAWRERSWDSCFTMDFSYIHGGSVRPSVGARYRHWITHKLASWHDQFDESGCVGCGRCITWCPVAIDITAEVVGLRSDGSPPPRTRTAGFRV